jgi:hypothetical protein
MTTLAALVGDSTDHKKAGWRLVEFNAEAKAEGINRARWEVIFVTYQDRLWMDHPRRKPQGLYHDVTRVARERRRLAQRGGVEGTYAVKPS